MQDQNKQPAEANKQEQPKDSQSPKELVLTIKFNMETHQIYMDGPISDEMFCVWLLDKAKDVVKAYTAKMVEAARAKIVKPQGILGYARRRF